MTTDTYLSKLLEEEKLEQLPMNPLTILQMLEQDTLLLSKENLLRNLVRQLSYSSENTLRLCERRFFLDKVVVGPSQTSVPFAFGHAVGAGVQTLWATDSLDKARAATFFAWDVSLEEKKESTKQSSAFALRAVEKYFPFYQLLSQEWELAVFNGEKAIEYSMLIEFPFSFKYRAFVDFILKNKESEVYAVNEVKTDGGTWQHEAKYKNSAQGVIYSLLLDQLVENHSSFFVEYPVYYTRSQEWVPFSFPKGLIDKVRWIKTVLKDIEDIKSCEEKGFWPMRGASCMAFGKPCQYLDYCGLPDAALVSGEELLARKIEIEEKKKYSFVVKLEEIVERYLS